MEAFYGFIESQKLRTGWSLKVIQFPTLLVVTPLSNTHAWATIVSDPVQQVATLDLLWKPLERSQTLGPEGSASNPNFTLY